MGFRHIDHYDGDRLGGLLGRQGGRGAHGHDHVDLERDQLGRQGGKALGMPLGIAPLNRDVLAFHIPEGAEFLQEEVQRGRGRMAARREHPDTPEFLRRLPTGSSERGARWSGRQRWPDNVHIVLLKQRHHLFLVCPGEALKEPFEPSRVDTPQQHAGL